MGNIRMSESELLIGFEEALEKDYIFVCYQPKINHTTGRMIGAEALMRWKDPENGMQYPSDFIPVLEKNTLIPKADLHVFEDVCKFQRKCLDENIPAVPISFNMSRYDIFHSDYVGKIEKIRQQYQIPVKLLHIEITESSAIGGSELVSKVLNHLHVLGYVVEMDDFGSGYSSLNVLKDLDVDVIKLDMRFLSGGIGGRGGMIISSVIQMSKWLDTPVIAEGVETAEQADFMKSIGCTYIQGYLYSKPLPEQEFIEKLRQIQHEPVSKAINLIESMDAGRFWNPQSLETLIFNHYVGGAAIFTYQDGKLTILRVNQKYQTELGMNLCEKEILKADPWDGFDEHNKAVYEKTIKKAIQSHDEESCETWRTVCSKICGEDRICIRTDLRLIGRAGEEYIFYAMVRNITSEKKRYAELAESERRFRFASEQVNIYAWEYEFSSRIMHPCFRCMRDLNVPPVVENYPEPLFDSGLFPMDYYDSYHEMLRKIETGEVDSIEAVIPLSVARIPFHVRYTLERDENGKPLKAYGSAAMVVDTPEHSENQEK
ncbi:MAG: EAL domain-containing protein [Oscillospiraceae bacterium]|nr:EAL domain-containing protein [Oscillospiraceae bacterium]